MQKIVVPDIAVVENLTEFGKRFGEEFATTNARFASVEISRHDVVTTLMAYFAAQVINTYAAYVLSRPKQKNVHALLSLEILAWSMVGLGMFMPITMLQFFYGLIFFSTGLAIHSRVCNRLQHHLTESKEQEQEVPQIPEQQGEFSFEFSNIIYLNLFERLGSQGKAVFPSLQLILFGITTFLLGDSCLYLIREWIPDEHNVSPANQALLAATTGAFWVLFCVNLFYVVGSIQLGLLGSPLTVDLWHVHPLLSESLSEFWSVRWNPIMGKLLQDSFYKPLRRLGVSRASCVVACFTGSAILHAVPQYIATWDVVDTLMVLAFFPLHGLFLLLEQTFQRLYKKIFESSTTHETEHHPQPGNKEEADKLHNIRIEKRKQEATEFSLRCKTAPHQATTELLLMISVFCVLYCLLEFQPGGVLARADTTIQHVWITTTICFTSATIYFYYIVRSYIYLPPKNTDTEKTTTVYISGQPATIPPGVFAMTLLHWFYSIIVMILLLPLYSLPVLHATAAVHERSFVIGPLLRCINALLLPVPADSMTMW